MNVLAGYHSAEDISPDMPKSIIENEAKFYYGYISPILSNKRASNIFDVLSLDLMMVSVHTKFNN